MSSPVEFVRAGEVDPARPVDSAMEYARCLALANDPAQSDEDRCRYRLQMEEYLHRELREAFRALEP